jgi:hypothetical protein
MVAPFAFTFREGRHAVKGGGLLAPRGSRQTSLQQEGKPATEVGD